jgi:hypothetical protein
VCRLVPGTDQVQRALLHFELHAVSCFLHRPLAATLKVQPPTGQIPESTMLVAEPVRFGAGGTIGCMAWCYFAYTTVLSADSVCVCFGGAAWMDTRSLLTPNVLISESSCVCFGGHNKCNGFKKAKKNETRSISVR